MSGFLSASIGRKYAMAISAMFLLLYLIIHLSVNLLSFFGEYGPFNEASYFMGYNWIVQYVLQPVLIFAIFYHFIMGFILERRNRAARPIKYEVYDGKSTASWMSRNMIYSGLVILAFLVLHMSDFFFHEMEYKYIEVKDPTNITRFWPELHAKFSELWRVVFYVICFVLLGLHLGHGFQSSFQSIGMRHPQYYPLVKKIGVWYSILIPLGFISIAIFHYITQ